MLSWYSGTHHVFSGPFVAEALEEKVADLRIEDQKFTPDEIPRMLLSLERLSNLEGPKVWTWIGAMLKAYRVLNMLGIDLPAAYRLMGSMLRVARVQYFWVLHGSKVSDNRHHLLHIPAEAPRKCRLLRA